MKKIFIIIIALIVLALVGWLVFGERSVTLTETPTGGLPFGSGEGVNIPALGEDSDAPVGETTTFDQVTPEKEVFRLSNTPTAGFAILNKAGETFVRYVDRATGHISDISLLTGVRTRVTNNTLPKIYEAHLRADGLAILTRSLEGDSDRVKNLTLALTAPRSTSTDALYGVVATNLRGDIDSVAVGSGNTVFYVQKNNTAVVSSNFTGGDLRVLFTSAFTNWRVGRLGNSLLLYTKASAEAPGYAYSLSAGGGSPTKLLGPLNGLTVIGNSNGTRLLYSYFENGQTKLFTRNIQSKSSSEILPATLAEKCVWSSKESNTFFCGTPLNGLSGPEPDNWYLGKTHFFDYIWRFDTVTEAAQLVSEPKTEFGLDLDVYEPKLSLNEDYMVFINKRDLTLWAIRLQ